MHKDFAYDNGVNLDEEVMGVIPLPSPSFWWPLKKWPSGGGSSLEAQVEVYADGYVA